MKGPVVLFAVSLLLIDLNKVQGLYEDQIGKFDWKKEFIGEVENAVYESSLSVSKHVYVSTSKNVIACISTRTGLTVWRKVLGNHDGKVSHLIHTKEGLLSVTVLGLARVWDSNTGVLKWEADFSTAAEQRDGFSTIDVAIIERSYTEGNLLIALSSIGIHAVTMTPSRKRPVIQTVTIDLSSIEPSDNQIFVDSAKEQIILLQLQSGARLLSTIYSSNDLEELSHIRIDTSWLDSLHMTAVLEDSTLFYISKEAGTASAVHLESGATKFHSSLNKLELQSAISSVIVNNNKDIRLHGLDVLLFHEDSRVTLLKASQSESQFQVSWTKSFPGLFNIASLRLADEAYAYISCSTADVVSVAAVNLRSGNIDQEMEIKYKLPKQSGRLSKVFINMFLRRNTPVGFRTLLTFEDHGVVLVAHPSKAMWRRDEALASVVDATMLDLPLSDSDADIEAEFEESENTMILEMFFKRVKAQGNMVVSWTKQLIKDLKDENLFQRKTKDPLIQVEGMTRDPFSLHKMIVLITKCGALFGIDSLTGDIVWRFYSPTLEHRKSHFFLQRTTAHFPHPPQAALLAVDIKQERSLVALAINPITGDVTDLSGQFAGVQSRFLQAILAPAPDHHHLRPLVMLDSEMRLHYIPDTEEVRTQVAQSNVFIYDVNVDDGIIRGFTVVDSTSAELAWSMQIVKSHRIVGFAGKQAFEKVDSVGRPLADRSVIYKYLNPNLVAVLSESLDKNVDRSSLLLHVVDAVTGQVIHSVLHKRASGPVHVIHSENWLMYSYWNTKARRTELSSLELYEGKNQYNSTAFSSFQLRPAPLVMQQAYIFSTGIASIGVTRTEKGLTSRQVLFGLKSGSLFGMPRRYFDPRRPLTMKDNHREEGLMQYMPEVPIPPELFLSYNLTIEDISAIYTAPAALESTSLILVTGLDIFFTRSQPSKMFDVLKEDFDYLLISGVVVLMLVGALATRRMAQKKQLKKAWR